MENQFRVLFSRMFQTSFSSCRSRNYSDIIEKAIFEPEKSCSFRSMDSFPPKSTSFPLISKPGSSETTESIVSSTERSSSFLPQGQTSPPISLFSPLKQHCELQSYGFKEEIKNSEPKKKKNRKKKKKTKKKKRESAFCTFSSSSMESSFGGSWWYSSDDEEDETEFFSSSKSLSSDSSHRKSQGPRRRRRKYRSSDINLFPLQGKVKDSFAVVKKSCDPYSDFRSSMVEMIVEKQIFSGEDLEQLLQSFLSLNSQNHHSVIVEVFTEIWETLFSDWGT